LLAEACDVRLFAGAERDRRVVRSAEEPRRLTRGYPVDSSRDSFGQAVTGVGHLPPSLPNAQTQTRHRLAHCLVAPGVPARDQLARQLRRVRLAGGHARGQELGKRVDAGWAARRRACSGKWPPVSHVSTVRWSIPVSRAIPSLLWPAARSATTYS
jgi:hypothetical protein